MRPARERTVHRCFPIISRKRHHLMALLGRNGNGASVAEVVIDLTQPRLPYPPDKGNITIWIR
jgi:hypothetical protein